MMPYGGQLRWQGLAPSFAALALATATAATVAVPAWTDEVFAARLALGGVVVFALGLVARSTRLLSIAGLPLLSGAVVETAVADDPAWVRTTIIGCLWYVAVHAGWAAIDRRRGGTHAPAVTVRLAHEIAIVVTTTAVIAVAATAASGLAVRRGLAVQGLVVVGILAAVAAATRQVRTQPGSPRR